MSDFFITKINNDQAIKLWLQSADASIFKHPEILKKISFTVDWWGCFQGNDLVAGWPIPKNELNEPYLPEFSYFVGPIFSNKVLTQPEHRKSVFLNSVYMTYINKFKLSYNRILFNTDTIATDIRYFLWENHDNFDKQKYKITPRYTAQINNLATISPKEIASGFRPARRRQIKNALTHEFVIKKTNQLENLDQVLTMYQDTLNRQLRTVSISTFDSIRNIFKLSGHENIISVNIFPKESTKLIFFALLFISNKTVNLVLNLTDKDFRDTNVSSLGIYESILTAQNLGCDCFDFNGANSPNRADDKHSYGAEAKLFFQIEGAP